MEPDRSVADPTENQRELSPRAKEGEESKKEPVSSSTNEMFAGVTLGVENQLKVEEGSSMFDASPLPATDRAMEHPDADTYDNVGVKKDALPSISTLFNRNHQGSETDVRFYQVEDTRSYQVDSTPVTASRSIRMDATSEIYYVTDDADLAVVPPLIVDDQGVSNSFQTLTVSNPGQDQFQTPRNGSDMTPVYSSEMTPGYRYDLTPGGYAYEEGSSAYQRSSMTPYNLTPLHSSEMTPGPTGSEITAGQSSYNMTPLHPPTSFHNNSVYDTPIHYQQKFSGNETPLEFQHKYSGDQNPQEFQHKYTGVVLPPQSYTPSGMCEYDYDNFRGSSLTNYQQQQDYNNLDLRTKDEQISLTENTDGGIKVVSQTNFNQEDITAPSSCGSIAAPDTPLDDITNAQATASKVKESKPEKSEEDASAKEPEKLKKTDQSKTKPKVYDWPIPPQHVCCWCYEEFMDLDDFLAHLESHTKKGSSEKVKVEKENTKENRKKEKKEMKKAEKKEMKKKNRV